MTEIKEKEKGTEKEKEKLGLSEQEINQLHTQRFIYRTIKMMNLNLTIKSFTLEDELKFVELFEDIEQGSTEDYIKNLIAKKITEGCLIAVDGVEVDKQSIRKFSKVKTEFIMDAFTKLSKDIEEYFDGYPIQELTTNEIEEYILTDVIVRNLELVYLECIPPLKASYSVLNTDQIEKVNKELKEAYKESNVRSKLKSETLREYYYAGEIIKNIDGYRIEERESLKSFSVEFIKSILKRADKLESQIRDLLTNPDKLGSELKNS